MKARNGEVRKKKTVFGLVPEKDQAPKENRYEMAEALLLGNLRECNLEEVRRKSEGASEALSTVFD